MQAETKKDEIQKQKGRGDTRRKGHSQEREKGEKTKERREKEIKGCKWLYLYPITISTFLLHNNTQSEKNSESSSHLLPKLKFKFLAPERSSSSPSPTTEVDVATRVSIPESSKMSVPTAKRNYLALNYIFKYPILWSNVNHKY